MDLTCLKGWLMTQSSEDKTMIPFFIKSRSKEVRKVFDEKCGWRDELYNDGEYINGRYNLCIGNHYLEAEIYDKDSSNQLFCKYYYAVLFFPWTLRNDLDLSVNLTLNAKSNDIREATTSFDFIYGETENDVIGITILMHSKMWENMSSDENGLHITNEFPMKDRSRIFVSISGRKFKSIDNSDGHVSKIIPMYTFDRDQSLKIIKIDDINSVLKDANVMSTFLIYNGDESINEYGMVDRSGFPGMMGASIDDFTQTHNLQFVESGDVMTSITI